VGGGGGGGLENANYDLAVRADIDLDIILVMDTDHGICHPVSVDGNRFPFSDPGNEKNYF
jgi:hypothetical protein